VYMLQYCKSFYVIN